MRRGNEDSGMDFSDSSYLVMTGNVKTHNPL